MMKRGSGLVLLGKVAATHGIRGQVKAIPYSGDAESLLLHRELILVGPHGEQEQFEIAAATAHGKRVLLSFRGIDTINQVLPLVGRELYVNRTELPELADDEFYWCDLLGLRVVSLTGEPIGELTDIMATGSNDVYTVTSNGNELLIPALDSVIVAVDLEHGVMTVDLPEGLVDS